MEQDDTCRKNLIQDLMHQIEQNINVSLDVVLELCMKLLWETKKDLELYPKIFAYVKVSAVYCLKGDFKRSIRHGIKVLQYPVDDTIKRDIIRQYNNLGCCYMYMSQEFQAVVYYLKALELAQKYEDKVAQEGILNNIGYLYLRLKDYKHSLKYHEMSSMIGEENNKNSVLHNNLFNTNIMDIYLNLKQFDVAKRYMEERVDKIPKDYIGQILPNILLFKGYLFLHEKQYDKVLEIVKETIDLIKTEQRSSQYYDLILEVPKLLLDVIQSTNDIRIKEQAKEIFMSARDLIYQMAKNINLPDQWQKYYQIMAKYDGEYQTKEQYLESLEQYYIWSIEQEKVTRKLKLDAIQNKLDYDSMIHEKLKIEAKNKTLRELSEIDALSKVKNRNGLNNFILEIYPTLKDNREIMGLIIVDIDNFKLFNDKYGHLAGDEYIRMVAQALKFSTSDEEILIRYGGDEFFVIIMKKTMEEVLDIAKLIQQNVKEINNNEKLSYIQDTVTVTQGIVNTRVEKSNSWLDYIRAADTMLYQAKMNGKDGISYTDQL